MSLLLIVLTPFLGALLPGLMVRTGRRSSAAVTLGVTLTALVGLISQAPAVIGGDLVHLCPELVLQDVEHFPQGRGYDLCLLAPDGLDDPVAG